MYSLLVSSPFLTKHLSGSGCTPPASEPAGAGLPVLPPDARYILLVTNMLHLLFLKDVQLPLCLRTNENKKQRQYRNHTGMIANISGGGSQFLSQCTEPKYKPEPVDEQWTGWQRNPKALTTVNKKGHLWIAWSEAIVQGGESCKGFLNAYSCKSSTNKTNRDI